jgi:hypothetical protein
MKRPPFEQIIDCQILDNQDINAKGKHIEKRFVKFFNVITVTAKDKP